MDLLTNQYSKVQTFFKFWNIIELDLISFEVLLFSNNVYSDWFEEGIVHDQTMICKLFYSILQFDLPF
jgi:hypothetical protein